MTLFDLNSFGEFGGDHPDLNETEIMVLAQDRYAVQNVLHIPASLHALLQGINCPMRHIFK